MLLLAFIPITAVWIASYASNVSKLAHHLKGSLFDLSVAKVEETLKGPFASLQLAADAVRSNNVNLRNATCESLIPLAWQFYLSYESQFDTLGFTSIYFGLTDGSLCGFNRDVALQMVLLLYSWPYDQLLDLVPVAHNRSAPLRHAPVMWNDTMTFDYSQIFTDLLSPTARWTKSYAYSANPSVWISAVIPFYDGDEHYGYIAYDADVRSLSVILDDMITIDGAASFMLEMDTWLLLATSYSDKNPFKIAENLADRIPGEQFDDPVVSNTVLQMYERYGKTFSKFASEGTNEFEYSDQAGNNYQVTAQRVTYQGADVILVLVIPQMYFLGEFVVAISTASAISILVLLLSFCFVIVGISVFVRPIYALIEQFVYIESMNLDSIKFASSLFSEIRQLQNGFSQMIAKLKEYRAFIPEHLLNDEGDIGDVDQPSSTETPETSAPQPSAAQTGSPVVQGIKKTGNKIAPIDSPKSTLQTPSVFGATKNHNSEYHQALFTLGLNKKDVTILCLRTSRFKEMLEYLLPSELVELHGQILAKINPIIKRNGGQMVSFNKEEIIIAFNALRNQNSHVTLACNAAIQIRDMMKQRKDEEESGQPGLSLWMSITTGLMAVGNIGIQTMKQFCVDGDGIEYASKLVLLCPTVGASILVDDGVVAAGSKGFIFREIDRITFPDINKRKTLTMSSLESVKQMKQDEWMYELEHLNSMDRFDAYKQGYQLYTEGRFFDAMKKLNEAMQSLPDDYPTIRLLKICSECCEMKRSKVMLTWNAELKTTDVTSTTNTTANTIAKPTIVETSSEQP